MFEPGQFFVDYAGDRVIITGELRSGRRGFVGNGIVVAGELCLPRNASCGDRVIVAREQVLVMLVLIDGLFAQPVACALFPGLKHGLLSAVRIDVHGVSHGGSGGNKEIVSIVNRIDDTVRGDVDIFAAHGIGVDAVDPDRASVERFGGTADFVVGGGDVQRFLGGHIFHGTPCIAGLRGEVAADKIIQLKGTPGGDGICGDRSVDHARIFQRDGARGDIAFEPAGRRDRHFLLGDQIARHDRALPDRRIHAADALAPEMNGVAVGGVDCFVQFLGQKSGDGLLKIGTSADAEMFLVIAAVLAERADPPRKPFLREFRACAYDLARFLKPGVVLILIGGTELPIPDEDRSLSLSAQPYRHS